jgi:hypothetical protein
MIVIHAKKITLQRSFTAKNQDELPKRLFQLPERGLKYNNNYVVCHNLIKKTIFAGIDMK